MKKVIISRSELAYPETLGAKLRQYLLDTDRTGGELLVTVSEWASDDDGIIRSGGALATSSLGNKSPKNNF